MAVDQPRHQQVAAAADDSRARAGQTPGLRSDSSNAGAKHQHVRRTEVATGRVGRKDPHIVEQNPGFAFGYHCDIRSMAPMAARPARAMAMSSASGADPIPMP